MAGSDAAAGADADGRARGSGSGPDERFTKFDGSVFVDRLEVRACKDKTTKLESVRKPYLPLSSGSSLKKQSTFTAYTGRAYNTRHTMCPY